MEVEAELVATSPLGIAVFAGTKVPLSSVVYSLDAGISFDRMRHAFPFLTEEHVDIARRYLQQARARRAGSLE